MITLLLLALSVIDVAIQFNELEPRVYCNKLLKNHHLPLLPLYPFRCCIESRVDLLRLIDQYLWHAIWPNWSLSKKMQYQNLQVSVRELPQIFEELPM
jgi:hypothetical protein